GVLPLNTFAQSVGYDVVEAQSVAITLDPTGAHLNPWGTVHGGLTATLLDSCMGLAVQSMLESGVGSTTFRSVSHQLTVRPPDIEIDGTRIGIVWDEPMPGVRRPWFECGMCGRRCRYLCLRNKIACRRCHRWKMRAATCGVRRPASAARWSVPPTPPAAPSLPSGPSSRTPQRSYAPVSGSFSGLVAAQ